MGGLSEHSPLEFSQRISLKRDRFFKVQISERNKQALIDKKLVPRDIEGCITQVKIKDNWIAVQNETVTTKHTSQNEVQRSVVFDVDEGKVLATLHYRVRDPSKRAKGSHQLSKLESHVVRFWFKITLKHVQDEPHAGKPKRKYVPRNTPLSVVFTLLGDRRLQKLTQKPIRISFFIETCSESAKRAKETTHELNLSLSLCNNNKRVHTACTKQEIKPPVAKKRKCNSRCWSNGPETIHNPIAFQAKQLFSGDRLQAVLGALDNSQGKLCDFLNTHTGQTNHFATHILDVFNDEEDFYKYKCELIPKKPGSVMYSVLGKPLFCTEEGDSCTFGYWKMEYLRALLREKANCEWKFCLGVYDLIAGAQTADDLYVLTHKLTSPPSGVSCVAAYVSDIEGLHFVHSTEKPGEVAFAIFDASGKFKYGLRVAMQTTRLLFALDVAFEQCSRDLEAEIFRTWESINQPAQQQPYIANFNPYRTHMQDVSDPMETENGMANFTTPGDVLTVTARSTFANWQNCGHNYSVLDDQTNLLGIGPPQSSPMYLGDLRYAM